MELIKDASSLDKFIKGIKARGAKLDNDIQQAALSAVWHFGVRTNAAGELIGDVGFINRLYLSLGKGARHEALTAWLIQFGGVVANTGKNKITTPFVKSPGKLVDMAGGSAEPWYDMKKSKEPDEVLDILALTLTLIKRASKPKGGQQVAHAAMLNDLRALAETYASAGEEAESTEDEKI